MKNPFYYRSTINRLNQLMGPANPGHVRLRAVTRLLRELSPQSPGSAENVRTLRAIDAFEFARHKLRDLYDRPDSHVPSPLEPEPVPVLSEAPRPLRGRPARRGRRPVVMKPLSFFRAFIFFHRRPPPSASPRLRSGATARNGNSATNVNRLANPQRTGSRPLTRASQAASTAYPTHNTPQVQPTVSAKSSGSSSSLRTSDRRVRLLLVRHVDHQHHNERNPDRIQQDRNRQAVKRPEAPSQSGHHPAPVGYRW